MIRKLNVVVWEEKNGAVKELKTKHYGDAFIMAYLIRQRKEVQWASPIRSSAEIARTKRIASQLKAVTSLNQ